MNWKNEYNHLEYKAVKAFWGASTSCWNRPASFMACWKRTESHDWCEIFRRWIFSAWYVATIWIGSSHIISPKWLLVDFFSHISTLNHQWSWNHTWYSSPSVIQCYSGLPIRMPRFQVNGLGQKTPTMVTIRKVVSTWNLKFQVVQHHPENQRKIFWYPWDGTLAV